jgi:hypothetical protein
MNMLRTWQPLALALTLSLVAGLAAAQQRQPENTGAPAHGGPTAPNAPFAVTVYGAFQRMVHARDFGPKVQLNSVLHAGATEAVGAASGLRGEITVIDGTLLVSYGTPCRTCGPTGEDHATLLASAKVATWHPAIALPSDLSGRALDDWIVAQARQVGLDVAKPFPVRLKGMLVDVRMHVLIKANPGFNGSGRGSSHGSGSGSGAGAKMAEQDTITAERIEGEVVGVYAPAAAQGVITHPGEPFHYHWVDSARTRTAHLDAFGMARGAQLVLPRT